MKTRDIGLVRLAEKLLNYGKKKGAGQMEVYAGEGNEFSVEVREGRIEKLLEAESKGISVKVIVDQRTATAASSDLSEETLRRLVDNAVERAKRSGADPLGDLPENIPVSVDAERLGLFDPRIADLSPEYKINAAKETERICLGDPRIKKSYGAGFNTYVGTTCLVNSNGFSGLYSRTGCSCGVSLQSGEGDNWIDEGWVDGAVNLDSLMRPEAIAKKAVHRVTRLIGAKKVITQNVPVVFEQPMTEELLSFLYQCVNGRNIYMKQSFLEGKLTAQIGSGLVSIVDDGLIPSAPGTRPFDREGVPARKTTIMEKGVLKNYLLDTYSGRKLGMRSTGNASGPGNLCMVSGASTPEAIIRSVDNGLFLTGSIGFGQEPSTGDLSRGAFGIWIEKGELAFPVAEITISGNLGQMLNSIELVGNDLELKRSISGPTIKVGEMTVGGI